MLPIRLGENNHKYAELHAFIKHGGFIEIPENGHLTFHELLIACQASARSGQSTVLDFEFRHFDLSLIYVHDQYYGSLIDFKRLARIKNSHKIAKLGDIHFWHDFERYAAQHRLTIRTCTQTKNSRKAILDNGLRLIFHYSKTHDDFLISEITSRFGNKRMINSTLSPSSYMEMESIDFSIVAYLKHKGLFNLPAHKNSGFHDLLMKCSSKECHSAITGTILGFEFKYWLLEIFYDDHLALIGENLKFINRSSCSSKEEIIKEYEIHFWESFKLYAQQNDLQIIEICKDHDMIIAFLNTGANLHFQYQEEFGDYLISVIEGDGIPFRESYRRIYNH
ncbi:hypothetical protein [Paenibacillus sp. Leaf72]|uniref:hypothetical protein n=1 Tax=Paenibacillus sp. Leaf72 TaxID=1736234 RepID=UPI0007005BC2|nr:hypothetical protein [Paenibacillus sp. Leaf72]KQN96020.1 hypothetical protein ASF12_24620 [Paenibacillus sp. Leaf72]